MQLLFGLRTLDFKVILTQPFALITHNFRGPIIQELRFIFVLLHAYML